MTKPGFTGCLLAGGKSTRMGRDKAGVDFHGEPLWRRQMRTLQSAGSDEILISGRPDACYWECGFRVITDELPGAGPLGGVASLLDAAANPLVMVLAIDMPFMTSPYLRCLLEKCSGNSGAVPRHRDFFEGLVAIYPKTARTLAREILRGDDRSMQHFVRECESAGLVETVDVGKDEEALFRSLNSAADLAEAIA